MDLLPLVYFCSAAETENFSETARLFRVPVSNISQVIQRIEKDLGTTLFNREKNHLSLNEQGRIYYLEVKKALQILEDARQKVTDQSTVLHGNIRLFIRNDRQMFPQIIQNFRAQYPNVTFWLDHFHTSDLSDYDLIITDTILPESMYEKKLLVREKIMIGAAEDSPWVKNEGQPFSAYKDAPFITLLSNSSLYEILDKLSAENHFTPRITIRCDDPTTLFEYLAFGSGVALVPSVSWKNQKSKGIRFMDIGEYYRNTYVYYRRDKLMKKCTQLFLDLLLSEA